MPFSQLFDLYSLKMRAGKKTLHHSKTIPKTAQSPSARPINSNEIIRRSLDMSLRAQTPARKWKNKKKLKPSIWRLELEIIY